jgi:nitrilase
MIVGPWGEVLARHEEGPGVALATLSAETLNAVRARLPVLEHRRIATSAEVDPAA